MSTTTLPDVDAAETQGDNETQTERTRSGRWYRPVVDIVEKPSELLVVADMPGLKSEDIDVNFEGGELTIHGRVRQREATGTALLEEYGVGDYYRSFRVSEDIDGSRISASYVDGVLTLHLPKTEAAKPRKITVNAS